MTEWILGFDAGCGQCSDVIERIGAVLGDRVTVAGLNDERIHDLRHRALGAEVPFVPTLLEVDGERVRAWTGPRLSLRLVRLLGVRRSIAVARALDQADVVVRGDRRALLKAVPAVTLGAFLVSGGLAAPAMAAAGRRMTWSEAEKWAAGQAVLPSTHAEVIKLPLILRKAVVERLPAEAKINLWQEQVRHFRVANPQLTRAQHALLDRAHALIPQAFAPAGHAAPAALLADFELEAADVLGRPMNYAAFGVLGQAEAAGMTPQDPWPMKCDCRPTLTACSSCGNTVYCIRQDSGCGLFWTQPCISVCGG
ncbi:bacteriocin fulvocin C-related protein [Kribbella sp. NPDC026611]|uniref:bacteriocin fulvocin C-related protein n=1 Tax=Kribbella sp. NPDC026611 TaxID=3154911 RepID=UPI0033E151BC